MTNNVKRHLLTLYTRTPGLNEDPDHYLADLLTGAKVIQIGGDETTGHGLCEINHRLLNDKKAK